MYLTSAVNTSPDALLARYETIIISSAADQAARIPAIKAANPGGKVLMYDGGFPACSFIDETGIGIYNVNMRTMSMDWLLTTPGSVLSANASAAATVIGVANASSFFSAGDMVLIAGTPASPWGDADAELLWVTTSNASSITVAARGYPMFTDGGKAHASGKRIALAMDFDSASSSYAIPWFDLTDSCQSATYDLFGTTMSGTYRDWMVNYYLYRMNKDRLNNPWDGIFVDNMYVPNAEILTTNIDQNRDNVGDGTGGLEATFTDGPLQQQQQRFLQHN
jgi:hypothetical protein